LGLVLLPLALVGCQRSHIINGDDARSCEIQGFPPGTDANIDCAFKREAEREENGEPPPEQHSTTLPQSPAPPRPGGVAQTIVIAAASGAATPIVFAISVDAACNADGVPEVVVETQPKHGAVTMTPREDFARLAHNNPPAVCAEKRVAGIAVEYMAAPDYAGPDFIAFRTKTHAGDAIVFRIPIKVAPPPPPSDASD
jgi:hypothetical protein